MTTDAKALAEALAEITLALSPHRCPRDREVVDQAAALLVEQGERIAALEGALKPFSAVCAIMEPLVKANPERWPDDKPNSQFIPGAWPKWEDFKRAFQALAGSKSGDT